MQPIVNKRIKKMLWTDTEKRYLLKSAGILSVPVIATHLNKSEQAVRKQASKLGIKLKVKTHATIK